MTQQGQPLSFNPEVFSDLKIQLVELDNLPGEGDAADKDLIVLIQEKEQLLKELRKVNPRKWTEGELRELEAKKQKLESEISEHKEDNNKVLGSRSEFAPAPLRGKFPMPALAEGGLSPSTAMREACFNRLAFCLA